jgi:hypothetical protein
VQNRHAQQTSKQPTDNSKLLNTLFKRQLVILLRFIIEQRFNWDSFYGAEVFFNIIVVFVKGIARAENKKMPARYITYESRLLND